MFIFIINSRIVTVSFWIFGYLNSSENFSSCIASCFAAVLCGCINGSSQK